MNIYYIFKKVFVLDQDQDSYINIINSVKAYVEKNYECELMGLDLTYMISVAKQKEDIKLIAQYMKFPTGGCAQLEVGNNQEYMLPLIGELRNILLDYQQELEKVPILNDVLEQFMYEKEEMDNSHCDNWCNHSAVVHRHYSKANCKNLWNELCEQSLPRNTVGMCWC